MNAVGDLSCVLTGSKPFGRHRLPNPTTSYHDNCNCYYNATSTEGQSMDQPTAPLEVLTLEGAVGDDVTAFLGL